MGNQLDCKKYHSEVIESSHKYIEEILSTGEVKERPKFLLSYIGNNPASQVYMRGKIKDCEAAGILVKQFEIKDETSRKAASSLKLEDMFHKYDGVILQLPLPCGYNSNEVLEAINPDKDIDGLVPGTKFKPCTALGVMRLLKKSNIDVQGKNVVILGRSKLVGRPLSDMMIEAGATTTVCNSKTKDIRKFTEIADIIVSATGQMNVVTPEIIKDGVVLIDVGITKCKEDEKLHGDIHPDCYEKSSYYTTVPGGIGLVTRATLIENIITSWDYYRKLI